MLATAYVLDPAAVYRKMVDLSDKEPINPDVLFNLQQNSQYSNNHRPPKAMRPEAMGSRAFRRDSILSRKPANIYNP